MTWEETKLQYTTKSKSLTSVPKDLKWFTKFNVLKMAVMEKVETDIKSGNINKEDSIGLHTIGDKKHTFGFTERYLNVMMHYAFEEGKNSVTQNYINRSKLMNDAFKEMVDILDDLDMIPENCNCDC